MSQNNGGNSRLDRIEKMIEQSERASKEAHARHERAMAEHDRAIAKHDSEIAEARREARRVDQRLSRFIKLGVKEARDHRRKMREFDEKMTQLASAQILTEEKMKELAASQAVTDQKLRLYLSSLGRSGNGKGENKR